MATLDERNIFKWWVMVMFSSPNPVRPTFTTSLHNLPSMLYPVSTAFNGDINNPNLHPSPPTHRGSSRRPWLEVALTSEEANSGIPAGRRRLGRRLGHMADSPGGLQAEDSFGKYNCSP